MTQRSNVLRRMARPTKKSYRAAIKQIVLDLQAQHGLNDPELAERLGCSAPTIANARKELTNLDGVTLANIEFEFGPSALDPFLALGGSRSVPLQSNAPDTQVCLALLDALHVIIETQHPDSDGGAETTPAEAAKIIWKLRKARQALDGLIALGEQGVAA
jgi:transcriptional regulator with XRE-family HTH domain